MTATNLSLYSYNGTTLKSYIDFLTLEHTHTKSLTGKHTIFHAAALLLDYQVGVSGYHHIHQLTRSITQTVTGQCKPHCSYMQNKDTPVCVCVAMPLYNHVCVCLVMLAWNCVCMLDRKSVV